ncbi:MAG: Single-stranded DNA-binding protein [Alphaproteobacteria bacterium MarineAlpha9_Bin2]|nr:MAG: Single-stranded DNA-binding protein [Alphaproteobacteria bacterium MarineAlpha9_Bin2]
MGLFDRSLNKVILIGNLGKDPEVRSFQNGGKVCNMTIATSESWKDKESSEIRQKTEWHRIVVYNEKLIELIEKYIHKGSKIHVEGQLETRKYTDEASGVDKYTTEVVLKPFRGDLTILDSKSENNQNSQETITEDKEIKDQKSNKSSVNELATELDDDIPF